MSHKYFNSIITSHKDRIGSLRAFLRSMLLSSQNIDRSSFEIVITDLGNDTEVEKIINTYKVFLNIKYLHVPYNGVFWKSKALNHCSISTEGKYVTMLDIDAVISPYFLKKVYEFYSSADNEKVKLCYRVKFLDNKTSNELSSGNFDVNYLDGLIARENSFSQAYERYTIDEVKVKKMSESQKVWLNGQALGNSHYTMRKEDFLDIGGYDERFIGWACEDLDFNRRAFAYLGHGVLMDFPSMIIFSMKHSRNGWMNKATTRKNEFLYAQNKKDDIIKIPITEQWGKF